jgi:hypothetical protein
MSIPTKLDLQENLLYSLAFVMQDILFPLAGYFETFKDPNFGTLSFETHDDIWIGKLNKDKWMYVNPATIFPRLFDRFSDTLGVDRVASDYLSTVSLQLPNDSIVDYFNFLQSHIKFTSEPDGGALDAEFAVKTLNFYTELPEDTESVIPPAVALYLSSESGRPAAIGSAGEFVRLIFSFDIWGRNDTEVIKIGSIIRNGLRVSVPLIDFNISGFPIAPNISGKGMEPVLTFSPVNATARYADIREVNFQKIGLPGMPGADRYKGTGIIILEIIR